MWRMIIFTSYSEVLCSTGGDVDELLFIIAEQQLSVFLTWFILIFWLEGERWCSEDSEEEIEELGACFFVKLYYCFMHKLTHVTQTQNRCLHLIHTPFIKVCVSCVGWRLLLSMLFSQLCPLPDVWGICLHSIPRPPNCMHQRLKHLIGFVYLNAAGWINH